MRTEMKRGFTLIELMVVVVLVMILSLAIVPTFREIINKAKFTEGVASISALRTKIKVFYVENGYLPGLSPAFVANKAAANGVSPIDASVNIDTDLAGRIAVVVSDSFVQRLVSNLSDSWSISARALGAGLRPYALVPARTGMSNFQRDMDVVMDTYAGAYFINDDYQYLIINGGKAGENAAGGVEEAAGYAYAIAVTAGAGQRNPEIGTGFGVMEVSGIGDLSVFTWSRYSPIKDSAGQKQRLYLQWIADANYNAATDPFIIAVPLWTTLMTASDGAGGGGFFDAGNIRIDADELKTATGWSL